MTGQTLSKPVLRRVVIVFSMLATPLFSAAQDNPWYTDTVGRIYARSLPGAQLDIHTELRMFRPGWKMISLDAAADGKKTEHADTVEWTGRIPVTDKQSCSYLQVLQHRDGLAEVTLTLKALTPVGLEGVYFWVQLPVPMFSGGWGLLDKADGWPVGIPLPTYEKITTHILGAADAQKAVVKGPEESPQFTISLARQRRMQLQDDRVFDSPNYGILIELHDGDLKQGQSVTLKATFNVTATVDRRPAEIVVQVDAPEMRFNGFGGNYCFATETPHTEYTLSHLNVAWARTQMSLELWEPENDNEAPNDIGWGGFVKQDRPGSKLRDEFSLAQKIQERWIPLCMSIWYLPAWMYSDPERPRNDFGREIADGYLEEVVESIAAYLLYAKRRYRIEPKFVSFNEPDAGVHVALTPQQHATVIKALGKRFEEEGLTTRMLLGDVSNASGDAVEYVRTALETEGVLPYVGALAFHTWGGATAAEYSAWSRLAAEIKQPLFATEVGLDPSAWRTKSYESTAYALKELALYVKMLAHASPAVALYWEYTADYALLEEVEPDAGGPKLRPTPRYEFMKQLADLTPVPAHYLQIVSSHPLVSCVGFRCPGENEETYVVHVVNSGSERSLTVKGLPVTVTSLEVQVANAAGDTGEKESVLAVDKGRATTELPAQSLVSLTGVVAR
ncbi:MAG: hypothetical protein K9N51_05615 [Candidatus Pacebacteria bacterium]|nr:hypothetical protein [Candidatus Paceibacterota bacterium]